MGSNTTRKRAFQLSNPLDYALQTKAPKVGRVLNPAGARIAGQVSGREIESVDLAPGLEPPVVPPPTVMPVPGQNTLEAVMARRRSIAAQLQRRGRLSTILTQGSQQAEPLGS